MVKKSTIVAGAAIAAFALLGATGCSGLSGGGVTTPSAYAKAVIIGEWESRCFQSGGTDYSSFVKHFRFGDDNKLKTFAVTYGGTDCAPEDKLTSALGPVILPYETGAKTHDSQNEISYELNLGSGDDTVFTSFKVDLPMICLADAFLADTEGEDANTSDGGGSHISPDDPNAPDPTKATQGTTPETRLNVFSSSAAQTSCYIRVSDHNASDSNLSR